MIHEQWLRPDVVSAYNLHAANDAYERSVNTLSILDLLPEAYQRHVPHIMMDFGCGQGTLASTLSGMGHNVLGCDASPHMIEAATQNFPGFNPDFTLWDGQESLSGPTRRFHAMIAKLVLEFMSDEAVENLVLHARQEVLGKGNAFVVSATHPYLTQDYVEDYFSTDLFSAPTLSGGLAVPMYHRSTEAYMRFFVDGGFRLTDIQEPLMPEAFAVRHNLPAAALRKPMRLNMRFEVHEERTR